MDVDLDKLYDSNGERLAIVNLTKKKPTKKREPFIMMFVGKATKLDNPILNKSLSFFEVHLLMTMTLKMDWDNECRMSQRELADYYECHPPRISKAISSLKKSGVMEEKRRGVYYINPAFASRGM